MAQTCWRVSRSGECLRCVLESCSVSCVCLVSISFLRTFATIWSVVVVLVMERAGMAGQGSWFA
jgi:hypothetical protein